MSANIGYRYVTWMLLVLSICPCKFTSNAGIQRVNIGIIVSGDVSLEATRSQIYKVLHNNKPGKICPSVLPYLTWHQLNTTDTNGLINTVCDLSNAGVHAVVSVVSSRINHRLVHLLDAARIPHISVSIRVPRSRPVSNFTLYTSPSYHRQIQVIKDLLRAVIKYNRWKSIAILQDHATGWNETRELIFDLSRQYVETQLYPIDPDSNSAYIRSQLSHYLLQRSKNILLIGDGNTIASVLEQANRLNLLGLKFFWVILPTESSWYWNDDMFQQYTASNILFVKHHWLPVSLCCYSGYFPFLYPSTELHQLSILEIKMLDAISLLYKVIIVDVKKQTPVTIKHTSDKNHGNWQEDNCELGNSTEVADSTKLAIVDALKVGNNDGFTSTAGFDENGEMKSIRYDLYSTDVQEKNYRNRIGHWTTHDGIQTHRQFFLNQFVDFNGMNIPVAALEHPPFYEIEKKNGHSINKGLCIDILDELAYKLNFSYTIMQPADKYYGNPMEEVNDTWDGMVGMLLRGEVMMAAGPFTVTSERAKVIEFSKSYLEVSTSIVSKQMDIESTNLLQVFRPFTMEIWASIGVSIVVIGLTSAFINRFTPYGSKGRQSILENSTIENIWTMYSSLTEQGPTFFPVSTSGRCILGVWWVCSTLIVAMYTAVLAAYLTVSTPVPHIRGLTDLHRQTGVGILVSPGSNTLSLFRDSQLESYQGLWQRIKDSPVIEWEDEALSYVDTGQYVYITDTASLEYVVSKSCKGYVIAEETFNKGSYAFLMPKDAPYIDAVNHHMMKILEAGLMEVWKKTWLTSEKPCVQTSGSKVNTTLHLNRVGGVFIIYSAITGCSIFLILCVSFCNHSWKKYLAKDTQFSGK